MAEPDVPEPQLGFEDSRRLTGPSRYFDDTAVTLTPLGALAGDAAAHARFAELVQAMAQQLHWPAPQVVAQRHAQGTLLLWSAPPDLLLTATEVSEWAWECCLREAGQAAPDQAQDLGELAVERFAAMAEAERRPALQALRAAAAAHHLPCYEDDDEVSVGSGAGSRTWPAQALPAAQDVPWPALHDRVPKLLVTGSNGKTTITRLLAAMARQAGFVPGLCSTEGVWVNGEKLAQGDYSGPAGARVVLRHPRVTAAVLETARGGILRRGLALRHADVGIVSNISADHFGEYGIDSVQDIAEVKLTLARTLRERGTLVLNGADEVLMSTAMRLPHVAAVRQAFFAADHEHPHLQQLRLAGGSTCGASQGKLWLHHQGQTQRLGAVAEMPLTLGGSAAYNVENLAAAALAAACLGWPLPAIEHQLHHFGAVPQDNPGRLERHVVRGATVLVDFAHNPDGLAKLLAVARALLPPQGAALHVLLGQAGNRDDAAIAELAHVAAAAQPARVVIKELPAMLRGRQLGEVPKVLHAALLQSGLPEVAIEHIADELEAAQALVQGARLGDVVVLPVHTRRVRDELSRRLA